MEDKPTLFDKIVAKQISSDIVYEDERVLCFRDINPQAPVHLLLIPKKKEGLDMLSSAKDTHKDILGYMMVTVAKIVEQEGIAEGFRIVINNGEKACQSVFHVHLHILGAKDTQFTWPPGTHGKKTKESL